jgi:hypothetical protein
MPDSDKRNIVPSKKGLWDSFANYFQLIARLMVDRRVSPFIKILPVGTLVYLIAPDLVPFVVDDALVVWLGTYLFIELCPPEVVEEYRAMLNGTAPASANQINGQEPSQGDVIDAEYWEEPKDKNNPK